MSSPYQGLDHIAVAVRDIDAAVAHWRDGLGFTLTGGEDLPDRGITVRFLQLSNCRIELVAPTREDSEISRFLAKKGEGVHHLCVRVDDVQASATSLEERGVRLAQLPRPGAHGAQVAFVHPQSTCGVLLELSQPAS